MDPITTADIVETRDGQAVRLPADFRIEASRVSVRRAGDAVILEPLPSALWPDGFFDAIRIDDPAFARPLQDATPAAPRLDER